MQIQTAVDLSAWRACPQNSVGPTPFLMHTGRVISLPCHNFWPCHKATRGQNKYIPLSGIPPILVTH